MLWKFHEIQPRYLIQFHFPGRSNSSPRCRLCRTSRDCGSSLGSRMRQQRPGFCKFPFLVGHSFVVISNYCPKLSWEGKGVLLCFCSMFFNIMEQISQNPGLQHIMEHFFINLDHVKLLQCQKVNVSWNLLIEKIDSSILNQPFHYEHFWFQK